MLVLEAARGTFKFGQLVSLCGITHLLSLLVDALLPLEGGGVLVGDGGLVRQEHGRGPEHVAERVVQQVEHGGGVYVRIPRRRDALCKLGHF